MPIKYLPKIKTFKYGLTGRAYKVSEYGKKGAYEKARAQGAAIKISQVRASSRAKGYERRV